jgi:hypothetical protein
MTKGTTKTRSDRIGRSSSVAVTGVLWLAVGTSTTALISAALGVFHPLVVLGLGGASALLLTKKWTLRFSSHAGWIVAVWVLAAGVAWWNASHSSEQLFTGRDDGTYIQTAIWIAESGYVRIPIDRLGIDDIFRGETPGFAEAQGGFLMPQFFHAYPALLATAVGLAGVSAALALNAVLGGLAVLLFGLFCLQRFPGWLAITAAASLAGSLPLSYFSRAHFSEPLMMVGIWGALFALSLEANAASVKWRSLFAGSLLGLAVLARLDALVLLLPISLIAAGRFTDELGIDRRWFVRPFVALSAAAVLESAVHSPFYLGGSRAQLVLVIAVASATTAMVVTGVTRQHKLSSWVRTHATSLVIVAAIAVIIAGAWAVVVRPYCCPMGATDVNSWLGLAATGEGVAYEPARSYGEFVARSLVWYLGSPLLLLAVWGFVVSVRRSVRLDRFHLLVITAFVLHFGYLLQPSITADQPWAARRLLPIMIPCLVVFAATGADSLVRRLGHRWRAWAIPMIPVLMLLGAMTTYPLADVTEYSGLELAMADLCRGVAGGTVAIVDAPGEPTSQFLAQPLRGMCGIEVWAVSDEDVGSFGGFSHVVSASEATMARLGLSDPEILLDGRFDIVVPTLTGPPTRSAAVPYRFFVARVDG